jgi:hypothetical protein
VRIGLLLLAGGLLLKLYLWMLEIELDPCLQFVGGSDSNTAQQGFRHLCEKRFGQVKPGPVFRRNAPRKLDSRD